MSTSQQADTMDTLTPYGEAEWTGSWGLVEVDTGEAAELFERAD